MTARRKRPTPTEAKPSRSKATFDLPPEVIAELRVASVISGETLGALAERALIAELEHLRDEYSGGKRFPMPSKPKARKGRPPKR